MAGRTGTSRKTTSRGKAPAKPRARSTASRKPAPRKKSSGAISAVWGALGRGVGTVVRAITGTKGLDPEHRRDGIGLFLIALAFITGAGVWWQAGGPVGQWVDVAVRSSVGFP